MRETELSAGQGALFLTLFSTLSQLLGFGYRVVLSRMVGAEVMGLYQLIMPVYAVLLSVSAIGLTSAISHLSAQHLALGNSRGAAETIGTCLRIFFVLLLPMGLVIWLASDAISVGILGDARTQLGLIFLIPCVALTGVENFHKHFFYGAGRVRPPAVVELLEQIVRTCAVLGLLMLFLPQYPERVVGLIVGGMVICEIVSSTTLVILYRRHIGKVRLSGPGEQGAIRRRRVASIALPVGANALLGNLLGAANATLIPQKLVQGGMERAQAMSQFGVVCGMTVPMLALPTVFLGGLNLVLSPRLARASALKRPKEVRRLVSRGMTVVSLLILPAMAIMVVLGPDLGELMFKQADVGAYLLPLAVTMALTCYCTVLGAALNGIGRQKEVAAVSLLGGVIQLMFTLILVPMPRVGMAGFAVGALASAAVETAAFLWLVIAHTKLKVQLFQWMVAPGLGALLAALTTNLLVRVLKNSGLSSLSAGLIGLVFAGIMYLSALQAQGVRLRELLSIKW